MGGSAAGSRASTGARKRSSSSSSHGTATNHAQPPSRERQGEMTYRVRNIGIAVALAAVAALLTSFYVTNYKRHVQRGEDHVTVLVAKHDIPTGTSGADAAQAMSTQEVPRRSVAPGAISSPDEIKDKVGSQTTFAGEQVTTRRFSAVRQDSIRAQLHGTLRAYQVAGDQNQLLAGTLRAGDHVDLDVAVNQSRNGREDAGWGR